MIAVALALTFAHEGRTATNSESFPVSVTIPASSGIDIVATEVDSATDTFGLQVSSLNFDPLTFFATDDQGNPMNIWLPDHYYAMDVGVVSNGSGTVQSVVVEYTEGSKPAGQTEGLGHRTTADFVKMSIVNSQEVQTPLSIGKKALIDLSPPGQLVTGAEIANGWLRLFVGANDGTSTNVTGGPISNADRPGPYNGTLKFTGTVL